MNQNEIRLAVIERANGCCEYCQSPYDFSSDDFAVEHIVAKAQGGSDDLDNLALSCQGCNNRKYTSTHGLDTVTGEHVRLYHPRIDNWEEHFAWNDDTTILIGLTPTARGTIAKLDLNRARVMNLRQVLFLAGVHPRISKP
jgi:HNH endonuclease